jgi:hypothetical protein
VKAKIVIYYVIIAIVAFGAYQLLVSAKQKVEGYKNNMETRIERAINKATK